MQISLKSFDICYNPLNITCFFSPQIKIYCKLYSNNGHSAHTFSDLKLSPAVASKVDLGNVAGRACACGCKLAEVDSLWIEVHLEFLTWRPSTQDFMCTRGAGGHEPGSCWSRDASQTYDHAEAREATASTTLTMARTDDRFVAWRWATWRTGTWTARRSPASTAGKAPSCCITTGKAPSD